LVPTFLSGPTVLLAAMVLASFIAVLGLNILTGHTGQISLGHAGFLAIGSYAAAISVSRAGVPPFAALAIAVVAGAVAGVIIGLPATRLTGIYLAVLTLVFTFAIPELAKQFSGLTGGSQGLAFLPPELLSGPAAQYWFVLAVAAAVAALVLGAGAGRLGRKWRAVRDSESGARALGLNPTTIKLGAFAISSGLGALGGAITGMQTGFIGPTSYGVFLSIYMLLAVILGGSGSVFGSLLGAIFITIVPQYVPTNIIPPDIIFGAVLIVILIVAPGGLSGSFENLAARARNVWWVRVRRNQTRTAETAGAPDVAVPAALREQPDTAVTVAPSPLDLGTGREAGPGGALLEVRTVSAGYGLFDVLHGASLEINSGEIVALVGANGAGKSTLLRVVSQTITPSEGEVLWKDQNLSAGQLRAPHRVARAGISHVPEGRAIFPDLTVEENLTMGTFGHDKRKGADGVRTVDRDEILTYFPRLRERLRQRAGTLSGGEQQMLAIGRALRGQPELLMLDEPSLGLAPVVAEQVFEVVREIAASGLSVLLVEQNAAAALSLAHRAYVIAAGEIVLSGSGAALREDERVAQTYLAMGTA
jgi:ABC-type branched-subunit amino acid transport system ATPase component/ABC-type branched-subunit amino acid transport system permease subunit